MDDVLITPRADAEARREFPGMFRRNARNSKDYHNEIKARIERILPPEEFSPFDRKVDTVAKLKQRDVYVRELVDAILPALQYHADEAVDHTGARIEPVALIEAAITDFVSGLIARAEEIEGER